MSRRGDNFISPTPAKPSRRPKLTIRIALLSLRLLLPNALLLHLLTLGAFDKVGPIDDLQVKEAAFDDDRPHGE